MQGARVRPGGDSWQRAPETRGLGQGPVAQPLLGIKGGGGFTLIIL